MKPNGGGYFYNKRPVFHLPRRVLANLVRAHLSARGVDELREARP
jgi:hypothetical protein